MTLEQALSLGSARTHFSWHRGHRGDSRRSQTNGMLEDRQLSCIDALMRQAQVLDPAHGYRRAWWQWLINTRGSTCRGSSCESRCSRLRPSRHPS
jgi:hypothetical protein